MSAKPRVPFYYWPFWMVLLALGLFVFYVLLTPIWMGIRFVSWLADKRGGPVGQKELSGKPRRGFPEK